MGDALDRDRGGVADREHGDDHGDAHASPGRRGGEHGLDTREDQGEHQGSHLGGEEVLRLLPHSELRQHPAYRQHQDRRGQQYEQGTGQRAELGEHIVLAGEGTGEVQRYRPEAQVAGDELRRRAATKIPMTGTRNIA